MNEYTASEIERYNIMHLIDNIHEVMEHINDGHHNDDVDNLRKIINELQAEL